MYMYMEMLFIMTHGAIPMIAFMNLLYVIFLYSCVTLLTCMCHSEGLVNYGCGTQRMYILPTTEWHMNKNTFELQPTSRMNSACGNCNY